MAASEVKVVTVSRNSFTKTLVSLASSTTGVGVQTDMVTNTNRVRRIGVSAAIKLGTNPVANKGVYFYLLLSDGAGTPIRTDGAGATAAALTQRNARFGRTFGDLSYPSVLQTGPSPATGDVLKSLFLFEVMGLDFGLLTVQDTTVALDGTEANHTLTWWNADDEAQ